MLDLKSLMTNGKYPAKIIVNKDNVNEIRSELERMMSYYDYDDDCFSTSDVTLAAYIAGKVNVILEQIAEHENENEFELCTISDKDFIRYLYEMNDIMPDDYQVVCHIYSENSPDEIHVFKNIDGENESEALWNVVKTIKERCKNLGAIVSISENYTGEYNKWDDTLWENNTMEIMIDFPFGVHTIKGFYITKTRTWQDEQEE